MIEDFSDKTNPFLVKELRAALRSKAFVTVFLGLHLGSVVLLLFRTLHMTADRDFYDFLLLLNAIVWIQGVISARQLIGGDEDAIQANKELLRVLPLSHNALIGAKIVTSLSLMALALVTLFPYWLIRYLTGGVEVYAELLGLVAFCAHAFAIALMGIIGCSCFGWARSVWSLIIGFSVVVMSPVGTMLVLATSRGLIGEIMIGYFIVYFFIVVILMAGVFQRFLLDHETEFRETYVSDPPKASAPP
jgi:hypothetical protein